MRLIVLCLLFSSHIYAQQYFSKTGTVTFFSKAPIEDIQAVNHKLSAVIDLGSGEFAFQLKIQDFNFPNSLMQEHFNESYLESHLFPVSNFVGFLEPIKENKLIQKKTLEVKGKMYIHGISKDLQLSANLQYLNEELLLSSTFDIELADFEIDIPKLMMYKIAEVVKVSVEMKLQKFKE